MGLIFCIHEWVKWKLRLNRLTRLAPCRVPAEYVEEGVDADAAVFVLSSNSCPSGVLAYASHCQVDQALNPEP